MQPFLPQASAQPPVPQATPSLRFTRDDDQLVALSYENLGDADYINRLFGVGAPGVPAGASLTHPAPGGHDVPAPGAATSGSDFIEQPSIATGQHYVQQVDLYLTPSLAEDIILFGNSKELGLDFIVKRLIFEAMPSLHRAGTDGATSYLIMRQERVFGYISELIRARCIDRSVRINVRIVSEKPVLNLKSMMTDIVACSLAVLQRKGLANITIGALEALLSTAMDSIVRPLKESGKSKDTQLPLGQLRSLRVVLAKIIMHCIDHCNNAVSSADVESFENYIRVLATSAYGLMSIAILLRSPGDVLVAFTFLVTAHAHCEDWSSHIDWLRGDSSLGATASPSPLPFEATASSQQQMQEPIVFKTKLRGRADSTTQPAPRLGVGIKHSVSLIPTISSMEGVVPANSEGRDIVLGGEDMSAAAASKFLRDNRTRTGDAKNRTLPGRTKPTAMDEDVSPLKRLPNRDGIVSLATDFPAQSMQHSKSTTVIGSGPSSLYSKVEELLLPKKNGACEYVSEMVCAPSGLVEAVDFLCDSSLRPKDASHRSSNKDGEVNDIFKSSIWSCGQNSYGELAHGDSVLRKTFSRVTSFDSKSIVSMGAGNEHTIFIGSNGRAYVCGYNDNGQCGVGNTQQVRLPTPLISLESEEISGVYVSNGAEHSLLVTSDGKLFTFGYNYRGQLGLGTTNSEVVPRLVKGLLSKKVRVAACSYHHSAVVCSDGSLYTFGRNDCGQLGHGDNVDRKTPQQVAGLQKPVHSVSCGQFHSAIVLWSGGVYACGKNDFGQLGLEASEFNPTLTKVELSRSNDCPVDLNVVQVSCGYYHTLFLAQGGLVFACGRNDYGQLGLGHTQPRVYGLHLINGLREKLVSSISSGCYHSVATTSNGMLYVFGRNNHGQLGTGDIEEKHSPHPVDNFVGQRHVSVVAGFYHTIVLSSEMPNPLTDSDDRLFLSSDDEIVGQNSGSLEDPAKHFDSKPNVNYSRGGPQKSTIYEWGNEEYLSKLVLPQKRGSNSRVELNGNPSSKQLAVSSFFSNSKNPSATALPTFLKRCLSLIRVIPDSKLNYNILNISTNGDSITADGDKLNWISEQVRAHEVVTKLLRYFMLAAPGVDLPYTEEEAAGLLCDVLENANRLLSIIGKIFSHNGKLVVDSLCKDFEDSEDYSDLAQTGLDRYACLADLMMEAAGADDDSSNEVSICIIKRLCQLRKELLQTCFAPMPVDVGAKVSNHSMHALVSNCKVLFCCSGSFLNFITFLSDSILSASTETSADMSMSQPHLANDSETIDITRCFKLFSRAFRSFRDVHEVLSLFKLSQANGLKVCRVIVKTFCELCIRCIESDGCINLGGLPSAVIVKQLVIMEHTCTNFLKCALPWIFGPLDQSASKTDLVTVGNEIISIIFDCANSIARHVINHRSNDDLSYTRNCVMMPNMLPTTLVIAMSYANDPGRVLSVLPHVHKIISTLRLLGEQENTGIPGWSSPAAKLGAKTIASADSQGSDGTGSSAIQSIKKDPNIAWLLKTLKLCVLLASKLSVILVNQIDSLMEFESNFQAADNESAPNDLSGLAHFDKDLRAWISESSLWCYFDLKCDNWEGHAALPIVENESGMVDPAMAQICNRLRTREFVINPNYRMTMSRVTSVNNTLQAIENLLFSLIFELEAPINGLIWKRGILGGPDCDGVAFASKTWHLIATLTSDLQTSRSRVLSHSDLSWDETLRVLLRITVGIKKLTLSLPCRIDNSALQFPRRKTLNPALRRVLMQVVCAVRWRINVRNKCSRLARCIIDTVRKSFEIHLATPLGYVSASAPPADADAVSVLSEKRVLFTWARSIRSLERSQRMESDHKFGMNVLCGILKEPLFHGMKWDVLNMLIGSWKKKVSQDQISRTRVVHRESSSYYGELLQYLLDYVRYFSGSNSVVGEWHLAFFESPSSSGSHSSVAPPSTPCHWVTTDIVNYFAACKAIEYLLLVDSKFFLQSSSIINDFAHNIIVSTSMVIDKLWLLMSADDKSSPAFKKSQGKERDTMLRRAIGASISLIQHLSSRLTSTSLSQYEGARCILLKGCFAIVAQLHWIMLSTSQMNSESANAEVKDFSKATQGSKDPVLSSTQVSQRKRCQELISTPMVFIRGQEGYVVQGDKLLSNFKGIDFTISMWIYVSKLEQNKFYFITGKVSHNDAWPILVLRGSDGKIDIAYGRANEFDKVTTTCSIPLNTWTHIAVVSEPRKLKIFVNGQLNCHTQTIGNSRAILYPLIIGSCPQGVRTRVEHVRDGFEGLISGFKYYTRALSPIHARVVFDQGPPELYDARERWAFAALAPLKLLIASLQSPSQEYLSVRNDILQRGVHVLQALSVSDAMRLRVSGLNILVQTLKQGCISDFSLRQNSGARLQAPFQEPSHSNDSKYPAHSHSSIMGVKFLTSVSFFERVIYYFIRHIGICWMSVSHQDSVCAQNSDPGCSTNPVKNVFGVYNEPWIVEFLPYMPKLIDGCGSPGSMSSEPGCGNFTLDKVLSKGCLVCYLYHYYSCALLELVSSKETSTPEWSKAMNGVIQKIFKEYNDKLATFSPMNCAFAIDVMGCVALLGLLPCSSLYPGCEVSSFYSNEQGRVLNIDVASAQVTFLTWNSEHKKLQICTTKDVDVKASKIQHVAKGFAIETPTIHAILQIISSLKIFVWPVMSDLFCAFQPDHPFVKTTILRLIRPMESVIFLQLLRYVVFNSDSVDMSLLLGYPELYKTILQFSVRNEQISMDTIQLKASPPPCTLCEAWIKAGPYLSLLPDELILSEGLSDASSDKLIVDYANKHLGMLIDDTSHHLNSKLFHQGMLSELIHCLSGNSESMFDSGSERDSMSGAPDRILISDFQQKGHPFPVELSDNDAAPALRLLHIIRSRILKLCQRLVTKLLLSREDRFQSMDIFWRTVLWHSFSAKHLLHSSPESKLLSNKMLTSLSKSNHSESIHYLTNSLRYSSVSLFHATSRSVSSKNMLENTDLFDRFVKAATQWIAKSHGTSSGVSMCLHLLKVLLPALTFIESPSIENRILYVCSQALNSVLIMLMNIRSGEIAADGIISSDQRRAIYECAKGNVFSLVWSNAHKELVRERGLTKFQLTMRAQQIIYIACIFEVIQRMFSPRLTDEPSSGCSTPFRSRPSLQKHTPSSARGLSFHSTADFAPKPPQILDAYSTIVEVDLKDAFSSCDSWSTVQTSDGKGHQDANEIVFEVSIRLVVETNVEESVYEVVYYGTALRFVHGGLSCGTSYEIRCRAVVNLPSGVCITSGWSSATTFSTTSIGPGFTFDKNNCGSDIVLSDNGLIASYTSDDTWSTVLGSHSFVTGINHWEIRICSSSTAYLFVGIATAQAELNTFLGGCKHGYGFIGEQALYHNREKVKIYGESFLPGDTVGVTLNLNIGTLSFSRNGRPLGVAFDKLYGEFYPAVAFYNIGQEVEILSDLTPSNRFNTFEPIPCSPSRLYLDEISIAIEIIYCLYRGAPLSQRVLELVAEHSALWTSGTTIRHKIRSGRQLFFDTHSPLLLEYGFKIGEKVRTPYGVASIFGVAMGRIWFKFAETDDVWFFDKAQIKAGRDCGLFLSSTYIAVEDSKSPFAIADAPNGEMGVGTSAPSVRHPVPTTPAPSTPARTSFTGGVTPKEMNSVASTPMTPSAAQLHLDPMQLADLLDPSKWSQSLDAILVTFLTSSAEKVSTSPWKISSDQICDQFRTVQQIMSKHVMNSVYLSHRWGVSGPKRRAVIARIALIRYLNHIIEHIASAILHQCSGIDSFVSEKQSNSEAFVPIINTLHDCVTCGTGLGSAQEESTGNVDLNYSTKSNWPIIRLFQEKNDSASSGTAFTSSDFLSSSEQNPFESLRFYLFPDFKLKHFWDTVSRTAMRTSKTDDEYDYPEELPIVKLNRFRSFRAQEASSMLGLSGEDMFLSTLFCQLWRELRAHGVEKLRISHTHPMDDGQSRAFKVKFEGEGVDDYGGPYREVFQKICEELKVTDKSGRVEKSGSLHPFKCFIPLLMPTPNWDSASEEGGESFKYTFCPSSTSPFYLDLYTFLGQLMGVAVRSKITFDIPLPSVIWKTIVREPLGVDDIASFDSASASFVVQLGTLYNRYMETTKGFNRDILSVAEGPEKNSESISMHFSKSGESSGASLLTEIEQLIQDLTWTAKRSDGKTIELVEGGESMKVTIENLGAFLSKYTEARLLECSPAVEAFRLGFLSVIPESALSMLAAADLERIVCGNNCIDIGRLRENVEYDDDVSPEDPHIKAFWDVLMFDFTEEEKSSFLRFAWARPTLPPRGTEFSQKLKIQSSVGDDSGGNVDRYLPKAHTCFFSINLPRYSSKEVLAERLRYAINNCTEMDADFRLADADVLGWTAIPSQTSLSQLAAAHTEG